MLSADEQTELDLAVWEYLLQRGFVAAALALKEEAGLTGAAPTENRLQRKWTAVLHLQARVEELETRREGRQRAQAAAALPGELVSPQLQLEKAYTGHKDGVSAVAIHEAEPVFASSGTDATIRLFDFELQTQLVLLRGHTYAVNCLGWSGDVLVSGSSDMTLRVWLSTVSGNPTAFAEFVCAHTLVGHEHAVSGLVNLWATELTVSCSRDRTLRVWDRATGFCRRTVAHVHQDWARCLDANARHLLSSGNDQKLFVFDLEQLAGEGAEPLLLAFDAHENYVEALRVSQSADESRAFTAARDKTVKVWDYLKGVCLAVLGGHDMWVKALAVMEEEGLLLSAGEDRTLRLWHLQSRRLVWLKQNAHDHFVLSADFRARGRVLVTGSLDRTARVWQLLDAQGLPLANDERGLPEL